VIDVTAEAVSGCAGNSHVRIIIIWN
jgi:hypothetical protein